MYRNITKTHDNLVRMFEEREPTIDAHEKAAELMKTPEGKLRYYVTLMGEPKLNDITYNAAVKTPVKYFDNLNHAKIFQLKSIFEDIDSKEKTEGCYTDNYSQSDINEMIKELKELSEEYPEYVV